MSKEKLYALRSQLSKFLYDPTPEQSAQRDKMWNEGRFEEMFKETEQAEKYLEYVEKQIEAVEAAEPSLGEKIVANTLLNLPLGKGLKGTGLGSLLGLAEEEVGAAEAQRLKGIEQRIYQLNAVRQKDLEGGKVWPSTINKIDADIRALEEEAYEIKKILNPPSSEEDRKLNLFKEFIKDKTDLTFAEEEFLEAYPEFGSPSLRQLTPEQILEELGAQEGTVYDEELLKNAEGLAKSMGISTEDLQNALQQGEKEGLMSLIGKTPTTGEAGPPSPPSGPPSPPSGGDGNGESFPGDKKQFVSKAFAQRNPTVVNEVRGTSEWFGLKLDEAELQKLSAEDAETAKDVLKRQKWADKRIPEVQMYGETEKRAVHREIDAEYQPYLDILNKKIKGYQAGGLIMNYGDYGRSYK